MYVDTFITMAEMNSDRNTCIIIHGRFAVKIDCTDESSG